MNHFEEQKATDSIHFNFLNFFFNEVETRACIRHALTDLAHFLERKKQRLRT
jgi:hypothetical protein